jgi:hypothetical protein
MSNLYCDTFEFFSNANLCSSIKYLIKCFLQVVAREKGGNAASAPLSLMVALKDVNDNSPRLPMIPPVTIQAGDTPRRVIKVFHVSF